MKRLFKNFGKNFGKSKNPTITFCSPEPATSTSTIIPSTAYLMPSVSASSTASLKVNQTTGVTTAHDVSDSVSAFDLGPVDAYSSHSSSGFFSNAQNTLVSGGTFISNILPANTGERQMKLPVTQKPNSSSLFTGREDALDKLRKIFVHHANSKLMSRCSCLLWGMGGIGKTQICLKFTEEMSDWFSHVFWVDASSEGSITMSLKGISSIPAAQTSGVDGSVESVLQWISCIQEEWLIVFDNADGPPPEMVAKIFPQGDRGNILITSRNRSMGRIVSFENCIEINEMEESDAITLLLKSSCLDPLAAEHLAAAREIVSELGCIPLAVNHAGAFIEAGNCGINQYLRQFSLHHQTLMLDATFRGASNYDKTVYGTWDLSFKEIEKRATGQSTTGNAQAAQAAILILQICAFYHHSNISADIFRSAAEGSRKHVDQELSEKLPQAMTFLDHTLLALDNDGHWDDFIFGQGVGVLLSFSLIKRGQKSEIFSVHPLVHCWSQEQMSTAEQQRMYEIGSIILSCAIPGRLKSQDYTFRQLIFQHIKANELHGHQMGLIKQYYDDKYSNFALVMEENGDWNNAEQLQVQVMDMRKKLLGAKHPDTLRSIANLAETYSNQGKWNDAEKLQVRVMGMMKKLLGAEHPDTLRSMGNLASTYSNQGRWNDAEKLQVQAIDMKKKLLGAEHPGTLRSIGNLASTYSNQGRWNDAEQLQVKVIDMRKKLLGAEHPDTLRSMGNLANTYSNQGRWNDAEQLQVQVMDMMKKLFGAEHPDTLMSMADLASTYSDQGRWSGAGELQAQVMDMRKKLLGAEHPDTLRSMGNLGNIYSNQGRWNDAEKLQAQVMDMMKKLFGAEHPDTLRSMANLASTYSNQRRWDDAEKLQVQVMGMMKKLLGAEHPDTLMSMANLAITYFNQGRWNDTEELQVQAMDMNKKLLGAEHPSTLRSIGNLANTYSYQGRWNDAEELQVQVMNMTNNLLGAEHPDTLMSMENLASTYSNQGRWNDAEKLQVQVMDMRKKLLDVEHPGTLRSMGNLASTYFNQGRWNDAEQLQVQVMDMTKKLLGKKHPATLMSMENLASTYFYQGRWNDAEKLQVQVMNMTKKLLGAEHPDTLRSMGNLASTYSNQGRWNDSEQLQVQVMDMMKKLLSAEHSDTLRNIGNL